MKTFKKVMSIIAICVASLMIAVAITEMIIEPWDGINIYIIFAQVLAIYYTIRSKKDYIGLIILDTVFASILARNIYLMITQSFDAEMIIAYLTVIAEGVGIWFSPKEPKKKRRKTVKKVVNTNG